MFFRFFEPYGYLNRERLTDIKSLRDRISAILYGVTYWGDYGGDTVSRYHYDAVMENAGDLVVSLSGNYGQGLVLADEIFPDLPESLGFTIDDRIRYQGEREWLKEFISWAVNAPSYYGMTRSDYPIFDETDYSDWEWRKLEEEIQNSLDNWMGFEVNREIDRLTDYEGEHAEPEELREAANYFLSLEDREYPYFESATDIVWTTTAEEIAQRILDTRNGDAQLHQDESLF